MSIIDYKGFEDLLFQVNNYLKDLQKFSKYQKMTVKEEWIY